MMKAFHFAAGTLAVLLLANSLQAEDVVRYQSQPGGVIRLDGTSTVHDWSVESKLIGGFIELEPAFLKADDLKSVPSLASAESNPKLEITIPVRSLRSGNNRMDEVMQEAMKMEDHRNIEYRLLEIVLKEAEPNSPAQFETKGELTIAGETKEIKMPVALERLENNRLKWTGKTVVKMTDFGIEPPAPRLALGLINTGDEVTVTFEWLARLRSSATARK